MRQKIAKIIESAECVCCDPCLAGWIEDYEALKCAHQITDLLGLEMGKQLLTDDEVDEVWPDTPIIQPPFTEEAFMGELKRCGKLIAEAQIRKIKKMLNP